MGERHQGGENCAGRAVGVTDDVLAAALEAYLSVTAEGRVVAWNPAAETTFGYSPQQVCGRLFAELVISDGARSAYCAAVDRLIGNSTDPVSGQRLHLSARHADGHEFPIEMTLTRTGAANGWLVHAFAHDVTVTDRAQRFAAVEASVSHGLANAASSTDAAEHVVHALGDCMRWPLVELWLVDDARQVLRCAARSTNRDVTDFLLDELEYGSCLAGTVYADGHPRWVADMSADTIYLRSQKAARYGLRVAVGVPISSGGNLLGTLVIYGDHVEDPEGSLTALLAGVAAHVGQYLERRHGEELAVELARTKDESLAMVTHELRNPLAVIASTAELFDEELGDLSVAEQRAYLHTITRSADRLALMTSDLLDLARLESGQLAIDAADADLAAIIEQSVHAAEAAAIGKHLTVAIDTDPILTLRADADRLRQVADNLLSNAIKYTPDGGTITITAHPDGDASMTWSVADTGIGIPVAERPQLFRRFYRASTAIEQHIPGTGLGLVITRAIIECHHGSITLADHPGPGTTFVIALPTKPMAGPTPELRVSSSGVGGAAA